MTGKPSAYSIILAAISFFMAVNSSAQPTLPDITGSYENGIVTLTWNCQYNAIKAISVLRSTDSISNYILAGYVKKTDKGIQVYEDTHPPAGKNYYKLAIVFNSGLAWRSNHFGIFVPEPSMPNEPIKKKEYDSEKTNSITEKESDKVMPKAKPVPDTSCKPATQKLQLPVSITEDTSVKFVKLHNDNPAPQRPKIIFKHEDQPDIESPVMMRSRYVYIDSANGHVALSLPDDIANHHYSLKFYDMQNHIIFELPKINHAKLIFDKRNFQHKGVYRFVIRKDYTELEAGYLFINP